MPTAAREPRGMLAAGSLRSPPMLKPAMTPERHPDRGEGWAGDAQITCTSSGPSPGGSPRQALPSAALQTTLRNLPWQLGRHLRGMKGTFVGWVLLGKKALLATKASYGPVQSNEGEGGVWQAAQGSQGHRSVLPSLRITPWRGSATANQPPPLLHSSWPLLPADPRANPETTPKAPELPSWRCRHWALAALHCHLSSPGTPMGGGQLGC